MTNIGDKSFVPWLCDWGWSGGGGVRENVGSGEEVRRQERVRVVTERG